MEGGLSVSAKPAACARLMAAVFREELNPTGSRNPPMRAALLHLQPQCRPGGEGGEQDRCETDGPKDQERT